MSTNNKKNVITVDQGLYYIFSVKFGACLDYTNPNQYYNTIIVILLCKYYAHKPHQHENKLLVVFLVTCPENNYTIKIISNPPTSY